MPGFKTFTSAPLTASDVNSYLMRQANIVCTSGTRPSSPHAGMEIYETDTARKLMHDGGGWVIMAEHSQSWSNAFFGPFTGINWGTAITTFTGAYHRTDGYCEFTGSLSISSGAPSSISNPGFTLPFNAAGVVIGQFDIAYFDVSAGLVYPGVNGSGSSSVSMFCQRADSTFVSNWGISTTEPFTWATGDQIHVSGRYRMASRYS